MSTATVPTYRVQVATPGGPAELDVPTFQGPDAAKRRAYWTAVAAGWGDVDEVTVTNVTLNEPEGCDHPRCGDGIHWTGRTEPDTGADAEEGPCPRWTA